MEQQVEKFNLSVFPNPSGSNVSVSFSKNISKGELQLYNYLGEIVLSERVVNTGFVMLETEKLVKGIYLLKFVGVSDSGVERVVIE